MGPQFFAKTVAALLVPCIILYALGCHSYQTVALEEAKHDSHLIVGTKDGHYFRLAEWTADSVGNIAGRGVECSTLEDAKDSRYTRTYKGTIPADSVAVLQADQPDHKATMGLVVAIILGVILIGAAVAFNSDFLHWGDGNVNWE